MNKKIFIFTIILTFTTMWLNTILTVDASGSVCDVFVDNVAGNDSNTGLSEGEAFKSLSAIPAVAHGTTICLKRGSVFKESLFVGIPGNGRNNITVKDYGPLHLPKPIIDSSDIIPSNLWTPVGGSFPNLYQATITGPGTSTLTKYGSYTHTGSTYLNLFECKSSPCTPTGLGGNDNFLGTSLTQTAANNATGTFFIAGQNGTNGPSNVINPTIYLRASDDTNPSSSGYVYSYSKHYGGLTISGFNAEVINIVTKKAFGPNGSLVQLGDGGNAIFSGIEAYQGGKHNVYCAGGCTVNDSLFVDEYYPGFGNMFVAFDQNGSGLPITLNNNTFLNGVRITGNNINATFAHVGSGPSFSSFIFNGGVIRGVGGASLSGIGGGDFGFSNINGLTCNNVTGCITAAGITSVLNSQIVSEGSGNGRLLSVSNNQVATVGSSLACGSVPYNQGIFTVGNGSNLTVSSSTIYTKADGNWGIMSGSSTISLFNTIIDSNRPFNSWLKTTNTATSSTYFGDRNYFVTPNVTSASANNINYGLTSWRSLTGQDSNSTTTGSGLSACDLNTISISGPVSGQMNQNKTFTVTPNKSFTGTIRFDFIGDAGSGITPTVLNFNNSSVPQNFTITPSEAGNMKITPFVSGSASMPAFISPETLSYTSTSVAPIISDVSATANSTSASIAWITDQISNSAVEYGQDQSYGLTSTSSAMSTTHSITLSQLIPNTTYNYRVISQNNYTDTATSTNFFFTTLTAPSTPTPYLSAGSSGGSNAVPLSLKKEYLNEQNKSTSITNQVYPFTKSLSFGVSNLEVKELQIFLNSKGFNISNTGPGSKGKETNLFGPATRVALIKFQKANKIYPSVGFFGPVTRAFIANIK